jgi:hypothetical protein
MELTGPEIEVNEKYIREDKQEGKYGNIRRKNIERRTINVRRLN